MAKIQNRPPRHGPTSLDQCLLFEFSFIHTLLTLLRILFLGRIGSISYVLPIRQNIDILNRDIRVYGLDRIWDQKNAIPFVIVVLLFIFLLVYSCFSDLNLSRDHLSFFIALANNGTMKFQPSTFLSTNVNT